MWARAPYMDIVFYGPYEPENGHRFNPNKLLLDPYAVAYIGELVWDPAVFGYKMESMDDLTFDERDSAPFMPKCVVVDPNFDWGETPGRARRGSQRQLAVSFNDTIIYEMHVRGYTKKHPAVPEYLRGTYCGLAQPAVLDYIKSLGVTSIELLPIHAFINDSHLLDQGLTNYWGYNSIGFFAPDARYANDRRQPCGNSRRWWRDSTMLDSKSLWTWSTTIPRKATNAARRCPSRASTTPATTG